MIDDPLWYNYAWDFSHSSVYCVRVVRRTTDEQSDLIDMDGELRSKPRAWGLHDNLGS